MLNKAAHTLENLLDNTQVAIPAFWKTRELLRERSLKTGKSMKVLLHEAVVVVKD